MAFEDLKKEVSAIISKQALPTKDKLTEICEALRTTIPYYNWVGFYFANYETQTLHLETYVGEPTDHTVIPFGKGICGQVAVSNENFVVADVNAQDNYIACSITVKSEIVIPLFKDGKNIGQIDIDSDTPNAFNEEDERFLEWVNEQVETIL
ncbi:GAF domain-containing protein [uncultured Dokdonia sp.]|uniref:GAF domain-containing protein n=1 Tax=uncultured Dokdonia sp. TaxID=575653 RepID=UPI00263298F7|nr:GAF domain-containing protein [uncultured Dokdonia sp.]